MAKDNFDLRAFLIENKMTVGSRGNKIRRHFLVENTDLTERKKRIPVALSTSPIMEEEDLDEAEDINMDVDVEDDDFIDPEDLPIEECDLLEGTIEDKKRQIFDRLGIDQESFNRFVQQAVNATRGNIQKTLRLVQKAYPVSERQIRFLVDKGILDWTRTGFGATSRDLGRRGGHGGTYRDTDSYTGQPITEDFSDIANAAAREQDRYADMDDEEPEATPDVFGGLGSTSYEAPEDLDLGGADEESIRRSYTSLKNQGINDERAMKILASSYNVPEETLKSMFKDVFRNAREKAVQVDEPAERVSTFRLPKRGSAAEKAAAADMGGEFDDSEDPDEFAKPGETDDDEDTGAAEGAKGTINYHYTDKKGNEGDLSLEIPDNIDMYESESELIKRLQSYPLPQNGNTALRRGLGNLNKEAAAKGTGTMYMYILAVGRYGYSPVKLSVGDPIDFTSGGKTIETKVTAVVAKMDCSSAQGKATRRQAADAVKTDAQVNTNTSGYGSMELSDEEIQSYVKSKAWNAKSIEQKLRDEYFPWSDEAKEYMDDDEIVDAKAELRNESPVDPESDWAKAFVSRR